MLFNGDKHQVSPWDKSGTYTGVAGEVVVLLGRSRAGSELLGPPRA